MRPFSAALSILVIAALAPVFPVHAQSVDSFFDIFYGVELPNPKCDPCKAIAEEIDAVQRSVDDLTAQLRAIDSAMDIIDDAISLGEENLKQLQKQLEEMNNPKSYVESEGRRYDSSDHAAMQRRNANLWHAYKGGRMTAQEYSDEIGKPFDDPEVADALAMLKEIIKEQLQDSIDDTMKAIEKSKQLRTEMNEKGKDLSGKLDAELAKLARLRADLADCEKRCKREDVNVIEDYGLTPDPKGFFEGLLDSLRGLFVDDDPVGPFTGLEEAIEEFERTAAGGAEGDQPTETTELNFDFLLAPEALFGFLDGLKLPPPVCHLCDPLRAELAELQAILQAERSEYGEVEARLAELRSQWSRALSVRDEASRALDRFDNPSASAESEGRFMDSNDQAAMRVRNAGLWSQYKSDDLSAQQLEREWSKPFDDPAVRKELEKIKQRMRSELEEAVRRAEEAMKQLDEAIRSASERSIELAGSIAGKQVMLEYLLKQIEECEKKCRESLVEDAQGAIDGYEKFIFPKDQGEPEDMQYSSVNADTPRDDGDQAEGLIDWLKQFFGGNDAEEDEDEGEDPEEEEQLRSTASEVRTSERASSAPASSKAAVSSVGRSSSVKTSARSECDVGTMTKDVCENSCSGNCLESYQEFDGLKCFKCVTTQTSSAAKVQCDPPTETEAFCRKDCFGSCVKSYTRSDGVKCFECVAEQKSSSTSATYTQPLTSSSSRPQTVSCPSGKVTDRASCESQCSAQGGTCVQDSGCYGCVVVNCPEGTYKNSCPSSCVNGCDTVGSQDGVSCYQCKQSCEDVCVRNGYDPPGTDYTNQVLSTLNGYTCVSGASVSITTGTIGSCTCTKSPNVSVNQTPPVCTGTTCGDVACGQSATCSPEPNTTVTVRCNWGGWKDLGNLRFQPVIGQ
ncbi:hypothetical protein FJZ28_02015 [Candidatus Peregrinibacteria bacterium]|nr:hypothetical protein [Candidatus Peregrinibacteria bacterium]